MNPLITVERSVSRLGSILRQSRYRTFSSLSRFWQPHAVYGYIGWVGHRNLGDEVLLLSFDRLFPGSTFLSYGRLPPHVQWARRHLHRRNDFDAVFLGGGTLINANYLKRLVHAQARGIPTVVFGTGVRDPDFWGYRDPPNEWADALNAASYVSVRGPDSAEILRSWGVRNVEVIGDPALAYCTPRAGFRRAGLVAVNLGCSGPIWGEQGRITDAVVETARRLRARGHRVEFLPMHPDDVQHADVLNRRLGAGAVPIWEAYEDAGRTLRRIAEYDMVIGQRLHAVVLSLGCGVPAISLAYRPKCIDFMKSVSLERFACRTDRMDADRLIGLVDEIDAAYDVTSAEIVAACDAVRGRLSAAAAAVMAALATGAGSLAERRPAVEAI